MPRLPVPIETILLVDDFKPWRDEVYSILQEQTNCRVVGEASDGAEALQLAKELRPALILLDISLPKLDGIEVAKRLLQSLPEAKIIFLTQNDDPEVVRAALSTGAQGYVLKADAGSELIPAVASVIIGDSFVSSGIEGGRLWRG